MTHTAAVQADAVYAATRRVMDMPVSRHAGPHQQGRRRRGVIQRAVIHVSILHPYCAVRQSDGVGSQEVAVLADRSVVKALPLAGTEWRRCIAACKIGCVPVDRPCLVHVKHAVSPIGRGRGVDKTSGQVRHVGILVRHVKVSGSAIVLLSS